MVKKSRDFMASVMAKPAPAASTLPDGQSYMGNVLRDHAGGLQKRLDALEARFGKGALPVRKIPASSIRLGARANRLPSAFDADRDKRFADLKASIVHSGGNRVPVLVRPTDEPELFELVYGERRMRACEQLGLPVQAIIAEVDDETATLLQRDENAQRANISVLELAYQVASWETIWGSRDALAAALGVSAAYISQMRLIGTIPATTFAAHPAPSTVSYRAARLLGALHRDDPTTLAQRAKTLATLPHPTAAVATQYLLTGSVAADQADTAAPRITFRGLASAKRAQFLKDLESLAARYGVELDGLEKL